MPIEVCWGQIDYNAIQQKFIGTWTVDEYNEALEKTYQWMQSQTHMVHLLIDASQSDEPPFYGYLGTEYAVRFMPNNHGACVVIGATGGMKTLFETAKVMYDVWYRRLYFTQELESAYRILTRYEKRAAR